MSKKLIVLFLFAVFALNVSADKKKDPLNIPVKVNYSLPRIAIDLNIVLERKVFKKGPFAQYAEKYLGVNPAEIINNDREEWKLINVKMDSHTQADPKHNYSVNLIRDYEAMTLRLSPEGFLTGFNTSKNLKDKEVQASIMNAINTKEVKNVIYGDFSIDRPYVMVEDTNRIIKEGAVAKGANLMAFDFEGKTFEDKAKEAAHIIFKLRKRRFKILTSNFEVLPPDGSSYKVIVKELKKLEKQYLELFIGKEYKETLSKSYLVIPQEDSKSQVVMRYSPQKGFVGKTDVTGIPVVLEYTNIVKAKAVAPSPAQPGASIDINYRLPAHANVIVKAGKTILGSKPMIIPQLGSVAKLSLTVVAEEDLAVEFHPDFGSIKNIYKSQR